MRKAYSQIIFYCSDRNEWADVSTILAVASVLSLLTKESWVVSERNLKLHGYSMALEVNRRCLECDSARQLTTINILISSGFTMGQHLNSDVSKLCVSLKVA